MNAHMNAPENKYNRFIEQIKQAETIIILSADLVLAEKTLSQKGKDLLDTIKKQTWRIDRELNKGGDKIEQEQEEIKGFLSEIRSQNNAIGKNLTSGISLISLTKASQLGVDIMISDLEEKIK